MAGAIVAGPWVRLACRRHLGDLAAGHERGLVWRQARADHVIEFFEKYLCHADGTSFQLSEWQAFCLGSLFGWYTSAGARRFRTGYLEIGKGNGKTPMAAGVGLYGLVSDSQDEPAAEIYVAATTHNQATIGFRDAHIMASSSPVLAPLLDISQHNIAYEATRSYMRAVSSEHRSLDGKRVHFGIIDELHEHPNGLVVGKIAAGVKGRRSPLTLEITNSGWDRATVCWEHHQYSVSVLEGRVLDDTWFAYVCALDTDDNWQDETVWPKANPNLGVSIQVDYLRAQVAAALGRPSEQRLVQRLNFCMWTDAAEGWLPLGAWDACAGDVPWQLLPDQLRGRACVGGLDLASTSDLTAFVLLFRSGPPDEPVYDVLCWAWCPEVTATERGRASGVPYDHWRRQGALLTTPGNVLDYKAVLATIKAATGDYTMLALGYDRWGATKLVQDLQDVGFGRPNAKERKLIPVGQGFAGMTAAMKEAEVLVKSGRIRHGGHPVLAWAIGNMAYDEDGAGNVRPDKDKASEKIDPAVAMMIALATALPESWEHMSVYNDSPLLVLG